MSIVRQTPFLSAVHPTLGRLSFMETRTTFTSIQKAKSHSAATSLIGRPRVSPQRNTTRLQAIGKTWTSEGRRNHVKRTNDAVYVNFVDVGYYNNQSDLTNSFQIIITYPGSGVLPDGNNAQLCYLDMNWSHGDVGGSNGCCGADPGVACRRHNPPTPIQI